MSAARRRSPARRWRARPTAKDRLDTGALLTGNLQNAAAWSATSSGYGYSFSTSGRGGIQLGLPQKQGDSSGGTAAATIAPGTITILDAAAQKALTGLTPDQATAALDRAASAQNQAATPLPSLSQILQDQSDRSAAFAAASSSAANLVGTYATQQVTSARTTADALTKLRDETGSLTPDQQQQLTDAEAQQKAWAEGGSARVLLHGITQGVLAGIGGGSALAGLRGAAGAVVASALGPEIAKFAKQFVMDAGIPGDAGTGLANVAAQLLTTGLAALVGGGAGAATAASVDLNNRQLHPAEAALLKELAKATLTSSPRSRRRPATSFIARTE